MTKLNEETCYHTGNVIGYGVTPAEARMNASMTSSSLIIRSDDQIVECWLCDPDLFGNVCVSFTANYDNLPKFEGFEHIVFGTESPHEDAQCFANVVAAIPDILVGFSKAFSASEEFRAMMTSYKQDVDVITNDYDDDDECAGCSGTSCPCDDADDISDEDVVKEVAKILQQNSDVEVKPL